MYVYVQQRFNGAGDGNRTRTSSLEGYSSTIELLPPGRNLVSPIFVKPNVVEGGGLLRASCPSPSGPAFGCSKSLQAILSNLRFSLTSIKTIRKTKRGGGRWIRTTEGMSQQIYSLPPLAAWVSLLKILKSSNQLVPSQRQREVDDFGHPALRPSGHIAPRYVQNRSRRFCRTTEGMSHADLQSAPVGRLGIPPKKFSNSSNQLVPSTFASPAGGG
jgi:hypothetical protein